MNEVSATNCDSSPVAVTEYRAPENSGRTNESAISPSWSTGTVTKRFQIFCDNSSMKMETDLSIFHPEPLSPTVSKGSYSGLSAVMLTSIDVSWIVVCALPPDLSPVTVTVSKGMKSFGSGKLYATSPCFPTSTVALFTGSGNPSAVTVMVTFFSLFHPAPVTMTVSPGKYMDLSVESDPAFLSALEDGLPEGSALIDSSGSTVSFNGSVGDSLSDGSALGDSLSDGSALGDSLSDGSALGDSLSDGSALGDSLPNGSALEDSLGVDSVGSS